MSTHPDPHRDTETELAALLTRSVATHVPTAGLSATRTRGRHLSNRRRAAVGATGILGMAAAAIGVQRLTSNNEDASVRPATSVDSTATPAPTTNTNSTTTADGSTLPGGGDTPVLVGPSPWVWNAVRPGTSEAVTIDLLTYSGSAASPHLMWSTAPAPSQGFEPTLYRSDDGIHWTAADTGGFTQPEGTKRGAAMFEDTFLTLGTAAATGPIPDGGAGDVVVNASTDEGATWNPLVLPVPTREVAEMDGVRNVMTNGALASDGDTLVAIVDIEPIWDAQLDGSAIEVTPEGVITRHEDPGVSAGPPATLPQPESSPTTVSFSSDLQPFEAFGIDPAAVAARQTPFAFVSHDGVTFTPATFPTLPDDFVPDFIGAQIVAGQTGFYAALRGSSPDMTGSTSLVAYSADGSVWEILGELPASSEFGGVLADGTIVASGYTDTMVPRIFSSTDGVSWQSRELSPLLSQPEGSGVVFSWPLIAVNEQGIFALADEQFDPVAAAGGVRIERDGVIAERMSLNEGYTFTDALTGEALVEGPIPGDEDAQGVVRSDGTIVRFTLDELDPSQEYEALTTVLLHSDDGVTWSRTELPQVAGATSVRGYRIQLVDGHPLLTLTEPETVVDGVLRTVVLVGTRQ